MTGVIIAVVLAAAPAAANGQKAKTLHYGGVTLKVPGSWRVERGAPPGVTVVSPESVKSTCRGVPPNDEGPCGLPRPADALTIVSLRSHTRFSPPGLTFRATTVNGLRVLVATTRGGALDWHVPSLGVQVSGSGAQVPAVLRTLRRA